MKTFTSKFILIGVISLVIIAGGAYALKRNVGSITIPAKEPVSEIPVGDTVPFLTVPNGFKIEYYAKNIPGARTLTIDPKGRMLVAQTEKGSITLVEDTDNNGFADKQTVLIEGLAKPHGMITQCDNTTCVLYVAESNALSLFDYNLETGALSNKTKLADIDFSKSDRHFTRSLLFLPAPENNTLLISVGSTCNVCAEGEKDNGKILAYNTMTKKLSVFATGLRNAPFMTLDPIKGRVFATEMGRDGLGDDTPPDEINIIEKGKNYGWPICYGKNIHDTDFDKNVYIRNPCMEPFETQSFIDLQAHSAPLGLTFIGEEGWPEAYWYNLLVAEHGSWNRTEPVGYKVERITMDAKGVYLGKEDFITGWLTSDGSKLGRPADIQAFPGGLVYITDDLLGVVYKLSKISE